jgi:threonine/homoserine/homoserine lactone efflux protein
MNDLPLFLLSAMLLTVAPGPDNLQVLMRGMAQGRTAALVAACGFVSGLIVHTALAAAGVALLLQSSPLLFGLLRYAGAGYLLLLGYRALRDGELHLPPAATVNLRMVFRQSLLGNLLNPKVGLFFLAFLPQFVDRQAGAVALQMGLLGALFMAQALLIFGAIGWFAAGLGERLRRYPRLGRRLGTAAGLTFIAIGLRLALTG